MVVSNAAPPWHDLGLERHPGAHLDRGAAHLPAALGEMHITSEYPAAVNKAGEQQRGTDHRLFGVKVAAILARRNGADALVLDGTVGAAEIRGQRIDRLRTSAPPAGVRQGLLALEPFLDFRLARQHPDRAHEGIYGNGDAG